MHRTTRDKDVTYKERRTTTLAASDRRRNFEYSSEDLEGSVKGKPIIRGGNGSWP
jgi:hypothetical protein